MNKRDSDWLKHLQELLMKDLNPAGVSGLTSKHHGLRMDEGDSGTRLTSAHLQYPDLLELGFEVESSYGGDQQMSLGGQWIGGYDPHYTCYFQFSNLQSVMGPDFQKQTKSIKKQVIKKVIDSCDVQVNCSCPAFYWQGHSEDLSKKGGTISKFRGTKGTGVWRGRHQASGGLADPYVRVCKHLYQLSEEMDGYIGDIVNILVGQAAPQAQEQAPQKQAPQVQAAPAPSEPGQDTTQVAGGTTQKEEAPAPATQASDYTPEEVDSQNEEIGRDDTGHQQDIVDEKPADPNEELEPDTTVEDVQPEDAVDVLENQEDTMLDSPLDEDETEETSARR